MTPPERLHDHCYPGHDRGISQKSSELKAWITTAGATEPCPGTEGALPWMRKSVTQNTLTSSDCTCSSHLEDIPKVKSESSCPVPGSCLSGYSPYKRQVPTAPEFRLQHFQCPATRTATSLLPLVPGQAVPDDRAAAQSQAPCRRPASKSHGARLGSAGMGDGPAIKQESLDWPQAGLDGALTPAQ